MNYNDENNFTRIETTKHLNVERFVLDERLNIEMRFHRQVALLGFPGVGKSSLAHHFVYKEFYNEYDPNIKTSKLICKRIFLLSFL